MKTRTLCLMAVLLPYLFTLSAQDYSALIPLKGNNISVYTSSGYESRGAEIAAKTDGAYLYFQELLSFQPVVILLVLSKKDWPEYTNFPVYGMPHYDDKKNLVVAAEDNEFWDSFIPPLQGLPADMVGKLQKTYGQPDGSLSMRAFFDLLAIHELGHAFHFQAGLNMQRLWLQEIFVNMLLHNYIADKEPGLLPQLTLFPQMVIGGGTDHLAYTRLEDVHNKYEEIGQKYPTNYGWYQCQWHAGSAAMHDQNGKKLTLAVWQVLQKQETTVEDARLTEMLEKNGCETLVNYILGWNDMVARGSKN
jgi:hypothetical protein